MKKVKAEICMGTTCFVMGGENLQNIAETLAKKYAGKVEVEAVRCLEACSKEAFCKAPYVRIDGEVIGDADLDKIQEIIEKKLNNE